MAIYSALHLIHEVGHIHVYPCMTQRLCCICISITHSDLSTLESWLPFKPPIMVIRVKRFCSVSQNKGERLTLHMVQCLQCMAIHERALMKMFGFSNAPTEGARSQSISWRSCTQPWMFANPHIDGKFVLHSYNSKDQQAC